jgi:hypothetical protein
LPIPLQPATARISATIASPPRAIDGTCYHREALDRR